MHVLRVFDTVALQRTEIVSIPQLHEQVLENCPVPIARGGTVLALEVGLDIGLDAVVVEKRIIDVDKENDLVHRSYPYATPCNFLSPRLSITCMFKDVSLRLAISGVGASSRVLSDLRRAGRRSKAGSPVPTDRVRGQACSGLRYRARRIFRRPHRALTNVPLKLGENARSKTTERCPGRCE